MALPNLRDDTENLNPFSSKGVLTFHTFLLIVAATLIFNGFCYSIFKGQLIGARISLNVDKALTIYGIWFVTALCGFASITNAFIKRWAHILNEKELGGTWKSLIRISLLSPALSLPITLVTILFFPRSWVSDVHGGAPRSAIKASFVFALLLGAVLTVFLPASIFGFERAHFRDSMTGIVEILTEDGRNPIPSDMALKPVFSVASPGTRYLGWLASDFIRTRSIARAIQIQHDKVCDQRLGYMDIEVKDCFFYRLRLMAAKAPLVSPYFALFYETDYRKIQSEDLRDNLEGMVAKAKTDYETADEKTLTEVEDRVGESATAVFANSLLMLSNQLELVEVGPMFIERLDLIKPYYLARAFGSPELPLIEFGQDAQRFSLVSKLLPLFEMQIASIEAQALKSAPRLGGDGPVILATIKEIQNRIIAVKNDPLAIGAKR